MCTPRNPHVELKRARFVSCQNRFQALSDSSDPTLRARLLPEQLEHDVSFKSYLPATFGHQKQPCSAVRRQHEEADGDCWQKGANQTWADADARGRSVCGRPSRGVIINKIWTLFSVERNPKGPNLKQHSVISSSVSWLRRPSNHPRTTTLHLALTSPLRCVLVLFCVNFNILSCRWLSPIRETTGFKFSTSRRLTRLPKSPAFRPPQPPAPPPAAATGTRAFTPLRRRLPSGACR